MKYIKFTMSKGDPISVDEPQAMRILASNMQLIMVQGTDGQLTGESINKSHIVSTARDFDRERREAELERHTTIKLSMPELTPEQRKANIKRWEEMRRSLFERMGWRITKKGKKI